MITPLDLERMPNNSEHHHLRYYAARGCRVTVLGKVLNRDARPWALVRDALTLRWRARDDGAVRMVSVDPPFNYFAGLRRHADAAQAAAPSRAAQSAGIPAMREKSPRSLMQALARPLIRALSPLACLRDVFAVPAFILAALRQAPARAELCIGFGPWGALAGLALRRLGRVERVVYQDRDYEPGLLTDPLRRAYTARLERWAMARADLVVCISGMLADLRRGQLGRPVAVIPVGVELASFAGLGGASSEAADPAAPRLVYVGNVVSWCGLECVIRALPGLRARHPRLTLRVIGDGLASYLAALKDLAATLGVGEAIDWLGPRPRSELPSLLAGAAFGLANSEPNDFRKFACPLKVMEYMAAGLPAVVTRGTEAERLVLSHGCGIAVDYDPEALGAALDGLLSDPPARAAFSTAGRAAAPEYDWDALLDRQWRLMLPERGAA